MFISSIHLLNKIIVKYNCLHFLYLKIIYIIIEYLYYILSITKLRSIKNL